VVVPVATFWQIMDTSPIGHFAYYLDILPTRLFAKYNIVYGVARLFKTVPAVLFLTDQGN